MNRIDISGYLAASEPESSTTTIDVETWEPPHLWEWMETAQDAPEYIFEDLIPANSKILVSGRAKTAFKSWMVDSIALAAASGRQIGPLKPLNTDGINVLFLASEGGKAQNHNRFKWLETGFGIDITKMKNFRFSFKDPILLDDPEWVYRVKRLVKKQNIQLVILDPLVMFMRGDENKVHEVSPVMRAINEISENGASMMFVHHLNKLGPRTADGEERDIDDEIRGSSALAGFYDQHWAFRKKRLKQQHNDLLIRSKDDEDRKFEVRWFIDKKTGIATFKMEPVTEEVEQERAVGEVYKELIPNEEYTYKSLASICDRGMEETRELIKEMVGLGMLEQKGKMYVCKSIDKKVA